MMEKLLFPFIIGFLFMYVVILLYIVFYLFLLLTLNLWKTFCDAESFRKKISTAVPFFIYHILFVLFAYYGISSEYVGNIDINLTQLFSGYCGFVFFIIGTRKSFGNKILTYRFFDEK